MGFRVLPGAIPKIIPTSLLVAFLGGWSRTLLLTSFGARKFSGIGFVKHSSNSANRMAESSCSLNDQSSADFEDYVRLKSNDGFEFIFPAATLVDASSTVRAMLAGGSFRESKSIISVPTSRALRGNSEFPASASSGPATSIVSSASMSTSASSAEEIEHGAGGLSDASAAVIAIDGPAASGKGTLSRSLAAALRFAHLDTGSLYRATALRLLRGGAGPVGGAADGALAAAEALAITPADLVDPELRTEAVGQAASIVSADPAVRAALLEYQQAG
jgi:hypothetical protein